MATRENFLWVRGIHKHQEACVQIAVGDLVTFEPEPDNPYDRSAIAILVLTQNSKMVQPGYVPAELTAGVGRHVQAMAEGDDECGYWNAQVSEVKIIDKPGTELHGMTGVGVAFLANEYIPRQQSVGRRTNRED